MKTQCPSLLLSLSLAVSLLPISLPATAVTVNYNFENLPLETNDFYNGSDGAGGFGSHSTWFNNLFTDFGGGCCWNGWAYSKVMDPNTAGPGNQYAAYPGAGADGSQQYGVAFSGLDAGGGIVPELALPMGAEPESVQIANTTYAAKSMLQGDGFAKKFGGLSGDDPDWFLLEVQGLDGSEAVVATVPMYLADFRFADPNQDYILDQWTTLDLSPLAGLGVEKIVFRLSSSDTGIFGMNTPAYFALDDLVFDVAAAPGDFDLNGAVGSSDLGIWQANYAAVSYQSFASGDANEDGKVDGLDFLTWQQHTAVGAPSLQAIPEPSTVTILLATTVFTVFLRSHSQLCKR